MASRHTHTPPAPEQGDNLTRISGIGPVVAGRLASAGIRTYGGIGNSTPEQLAAALVGLPGCSADRIRTADWIGQAERLGSARPSAPARVAARPEPEASDPPPLRVVRLGRAPIRPVHDVSRTDQRTAVGLELRPTTAAAPASALDYAAAITARRLDAGDEIPITRVRGVVRLDRGVSHSASGPPLEAGLYRLVATIELRLQSGEEGDAAVWREAVSGDLFQVVAPAGAARQPNGRARKPHPAGKRLLDDGVISEAEYADLQVPGSS
jgi:hypothetical protein